MVDAIFTYERMVEAIVIPDLAAKDRSLKVPPLIVYFAIYVYS